MSSFLMSPAVGLASLPTEILIETALLIPWGRTGLTDLRLTCRHFNDILQQYEYSITRDLIKTQFPPSSQQRFPGLFRGGVIRYATVDKVRSRWKTLERIEKSCQDIRDRNGKQAGWMTPRSIKLQSVGLCLLFRLYDCASPKEKVTLIRSLPPTSLAVLLFTLVMSIYQLRACGPDIIHNQSPVQVSALRAEIELACEELLLQHGASYLESLLNHNPEAVEMLEVEYDSMEARQMPDTDGQPKPPTLISVLRRAFAAGLGCDLQDNHSHMWNLLHGDRLGNISEEDAGRIIGGADMRI